MDDYKTLLCHINFNFSTNLCDVQIYNVYDKRYLTCFNNIKFVSNNNYNVVEMFNNVHTEIYENGIVYSIEYSPEIFHAENLYFTYNQKSNNMFILCKIEINSQKDDKKSRIQTSFDPLFNSRMARLMTQGDPTYVAEFKTFEECMEYVRHHTIINTCNL